MNGIWKIMRAAAIGSALLVSPAAALALPLTYAPNIAAVSAASATAVEQVQFRGGHRHSGGGVGLGLGLGIVGGLIIGEALNNDYQYNNTYYDNGYYDNGYYDGPGYSDEYCARRFRSYDPSSGTYLGYDGRRHSCP